MIKKRLDLHIPNKILNFARSNNKKKNNYVEISFFD